MGRAKGCPLVRTRFRQTSGNPPDREPALEMVATEPPTQTATAGGQPQAGLPLPALIADVGGTNVRFAFIDERRAPTEPVRGPVSHYTGLDDAIARLAMAHAPLHPRTAVLALAGPIGWGGATLTNSGWRADIAELQSRFGFEKVVLVNDWAATALALPFLRSGDLDPVGPPSTGAGGTRIALGPGTGLGIAALAETRCGFAPLASEGGHVSFGPLHSEEHELWRRLDRAHGPLDAETILSGPGLVRLHRALSEMSGGARDGLERASDIVKAAVSGRDGVAVETVRLFAALLGRFAADVALTYVATGGVYLAGGVTARITPFIKEGGFRREFDRASRCSVLKAVPTAIITARDPALIGLARFIADPTAFALNV